MHQAQSGLKGKVGKRLGLLLADRAGEIALIRINQPERSVTELKGSNQGFMTSDPGIFNGRELRVGLFAGRNECGLPTSEHIMNPAFSLGGNQEVSLPVFCIRSERNSRAVASFSLR